MAAKKLIEVEEKVEGQEEKPDKRGGGEGY